MNTKIQKLLDSKLSTLNSQLSTHYGYTLIELLAVTSILVILSGIIGGILYSTLRGSSNVRGSTQISQNGVYAISLIERTVSDSRNVTQVDDIDIDDCTEPHVGTRSITLMRPDKSITRLSCDPIDSVYTIASNGESLIDTKNVEVEDNSCYFSCSQLVQDPYSIPKVNISFNIVGKSGSTLPAFTASISSSLRVYNP